MRRWSAVLAGAIAAAAVCGPAAARERARARLRCVFDSGPHLRPAQLRAEARDDDLRCAVSVSGVRPGADRIAGELTLVPAGAPRTVASGLLAGGGERRAGELSVPHGTWKTAVRRDARGRPFLELRLRVYEAGARG